MVVSHKYWAAVTCMLQCCVTANLQLSIAPERRPRVKGRFVKQSDFDDMQHGDVKDSQATVDACIKACVEEGCDALQPGLKLDEDTHFLF